MVRWMTSLQSFKSLEVVKDALREVRKSSYSGGSWNGFTTDSAIKSYVYGDAGVLVSYGAAGSNYYHLLFHRVPRRADRGATTGDDAWEGDAIDCGVCDKADSMLVVGKYGYQPGIVTSAGVPFASKVWLLPPYDDFNLIREGGIFLSPRHSMFQVSGIGGPRIMGVRHWMSYGFAHGEEGLIERIPQVVQSIGKMHSDLGGDGLNLPKYQEILSCLRIDLSHKSKTVILRVSRESLIPFIKASLCPIDSLLRTLENVHA